jgi:hypothetical protein
VTLTHVKKTAGGRRASFKPEYADLAYKFALLGATNEQLAQFFGVTTTAIERWLVKQPEFYDAVKRGREVADATVADSLFRRATGYSHPDYVSSSYQGVVTLTETTKYYPPDVSAAIFWLKNRQREKWHEVPRHELAGKDRGTIETTDASLADLHAELSRRGVLLPQCAAVPITHRP